jgi:transposase-like protein
MTKEERHKRRGGQKKGHSESFRKQLVLTVLQENLTLNEAAKRFGIPNQTISRWVLRHYDEIEQTNVISSMNHSPTSLPQMIEYESKLREAQLKISALETMIELAEDTYKIAIRKNSGTKQHG